MSDILKRSEVEQVKARSNYLRGALVQSLENGITGALFPDDTHLIKFHGAYQQTDRDLDSERKRQKLEPLYSFMIRVRVPGGVATPRQWLRMDELADRFGNGTLKLTTRQAFQLHGVSKRHMKAAIQGFNEVLLDSLAGCGDVNRNVMAPANPGESWLHAEVYALAKAISTAFTPKTRAYVETWLEAPSSDESSDPIVSSAYSSDDLRSSDEEPLYGKSYLPRKFKIALAVPPQNDTDVFANDIGLIAIVEDGVLQGFNVATGGGMGMTFGAPETFPRLADVLGFVETSQVLAVCEAILTTQRDHGNRENRKLSRLKYTIERMGLAAFKAEVERRSGIAFQGEKAYQFTGNGDRFGWSNSDDGRLHLTLFIEGGRIADRNGYLLKTALRTAAAVLEGDEATFRLTGNQNLVLAGIPKQKRLAVEALLEKYGVLQATFQQTALRQHSLACVALNTCSQAFAEAERYLPSLLDKLDARIRAHGLEQEAITIRMTGCPNGCARPYLAEIGLVGKAVGYYNLYLGAAHDGSRLNRLYREMLDEAGILATLEPLFSDYAAGRRRGEKFGDFVVRLGMFTTA